MRYLKVEFSEEKNVLEKIQNFIKVQWHPGFYGVKHFLLAGVEMQSNGESLKNNSTHVYKHML